MSILWMLIDNYCNKMQTEKQKYHDHNDQKMKFILSYIMAGIVFSWLFVHKILCFLCQP